MWIVDDSATARLQLERLVGERYALRVFSDGATMLEALANAPSPDLLLLDWEMPGMTGIEVARFVRTQRDEIELPILMVTAREEQSTASEALAAGANDIVRRPFDAAELLARIKNVLQLRQLADTRMSSLRALFAQVPAAVAHLRGPTHVYDLANASYLALVGEQQVVGRTLAEVYPHPKLVAELARAYRSGDAILLEELLIGIDRAELYFTITLQPTRDGAGDVDGVFVHAVEVTARVHAKQRASFDAEHAERARAQLAALFRQAPVAIALLRGPTHIVELANPHVCMLWGRTEAQVLGKPLFTTLPEIIGFGLEPLLAGVLATGVAHVGTEQFVPVARGPGGALEDVYFNFVYEPLGDDAVLVVATDVTTSVLARRETERLAAALREREERLRLALEASEAGAWEVDLATKIVDGDPLVRGLFGLRDDESFTLASAFARMSPEDAARVANSIDRAIAGDRGGAYAEQYRVGETWISARGQVLFDTAGVPARFVGTLLDISARKEAEALLERTADFERYVVAMVSHDLRTPMQAISTGTELLLTAGELSDLATRTLHRIRNNADRATRMIRDVLDFTQVRLGGGFTLHRKPEDLAAIATEMLDELRATAPDREIVLRASGETTGNWDADRLAQVVSNLVGNALKYSAPGSAVDVTVRGDGDGVDLDVHNLGPTIPRERIPALFLPMHRASADARNLQRSVGLGLYIVDHIVAGHGGTIAVASTDDAGTTFHVHLPR